MSHDYELDEFLYIDDYFLQLNPESKLYIELNQTLNPKISKTTIYKNNNLYIHHKFKNVDNIFHEIINFLKNQNIDYDYESLDISFFNNWLKENKIELNLILLIPKNLDQTNINHIKMICDNLNLYKHKVIVIKYF